MQRHMNPICPYSLKIVGTKYYFLRCQSNAIFGTKLMNELNCVNSLLVTFKLKEIVKNFWYRDEKFDNDCNLKILIATIKIIKLT